MNELPQGWCVFDEAESLAHQAVELILNTAEQAIAERGAFHLVTAGGTTPNRCYELLREQKHQAWSKWFIYMGDERVLALDDPQRNSVSLYQAWLSSVPIPAENIQLIPTELGLERAVVLYNQTLAAVGTFDLVMLGMGEDGHTASLFPAQQNQLDSADVIGIRSAPKPPSERVSLSYQRLANTRVMLKLISGVSKHEALQAWLNKQSLPINQLMAQQQTYVYIDQAAYSGVKSHLI